MLDVAKWGELGVVGLCVFSLFVLVKLFIATIEKKDDFISELISEDRQERQDDRKQHAETTNRLASAIDDLTRELRK